MRLTDGWIVVIIVVVSCLLLLSLGIYHIPDEDEPAQVEGRHRR